MTTTELIELAKALAWPGVVGWGLWYFRDTIISQLPRVTKVGPVALEPPQPPQAAAAKAIIAETTTNEGIKRLEAMMPPELLAEGKKLVQDSVPTSIRDNREAEIEYLTALAATTTLIALFETAYGPIWGSQLKLLQALNSMPMSPESAKGFYDQAATEYPMAYQGYSFDQWMAFLMANFLVGKTVEGQFQITIRGRGFLRYLIESGYNLLKAF